MNALEEAARLGRAFEGIEDGDKLKPGLQPYRDPVALWTIGYGHLLSLDKTIPMPDLTWSMPQAEEALTIGMAQRMTVVRNLIRISPTVGQIGALTDFAFNLGLGSLKASTLLRLVNKKDFAGAAKEFAKWKFAGGRVLSGLIRRREAERLLFLS